MTKLLVASIAAAALFSVPALAAPPAAPMFNWTGWYVGGHAGYGWNRKDVNFDPANANAVFYFTGGAVPSVVPTSPAGFLGGGQVGYNYQTGHFVWGTEADISGTGIHGKGTVNTAAGAGAFAPIATEANEKLNVFGSVRGRLAYAADHVLIFATGGFAYGQATLATNIHDLTQCAPLGLCAATTTTKWLTGRTVGGGIEVALAHNWSFKGEYLYYDLGHISHTAVDGTGGFFFRSSGDFLGQIVRVGLNYKFGSQ